MKFVWVKLLHDPCHYWNKQSNGQYIFKTVVYIIQGYVKFKPSKYGLET